MSSKKNYSPDLKENAVELVATLGKVPRLSHKRRPNALTRDALAELEAGRGRVADDIEELLRQLHSRV